MILRDPVCFDRLSVKNSEFRDIFDADWYVATYPDVRISGADPAEHYLRIGAHLHRPPRAREPQIAKSESVSTRFSIDAYRLANQGVPKEPRAAWAHRLAHPHREDLISNWLDFYVERTFSHAERKRVSSLVDLVLSAAKDGNTHSTVTFERLRHRFCQAHDTALRTKISQGAPSVSIIIPVHNQVSFTLACVTSVLESMPQSSYEIVIADDCSTDETGDCFGATSSLLRTVRSEGNLGFLRNCNSAASTCRSEYLVLLNNDTIVLPGWLDELTATFQGSPKCGMVGSKLLNVDGTLQEAGGIIWKDGSGWNFGRGSDPAAPAFNYRKPVDYCSGASICLRNETWRLVGGFDESYAPAYCEDSDLAFRLRSIGFETYYNPHSVAVHFEGASCGTDITKGIKSYQQRNQKQLYATWRSVLDSQHFAHGTQVSQARDRSGGRHRVLVVDSTTPTPDCDAGSLTCLNTMLILQHLNFHVMFLPESNLAAIPRYTKQLQSFGIEALYFSSRDELVKWFVDEAAALDLALVFRPDTYASIHPLLATYCPDCPVVYHTVDLHFLRLERQAALTQCALISDQARKMKQLELKLIQDADASIVHSDVERSVLEALIPTDNLRVVPLVLDVSRNVPPHDRRRDVVFVGGYKHPPNIDAVCYFVREVMPSLRVKLPGIRFHIVGSHPPQEVLDLASEDVIIRGFVESLTPLLDEMLVSVAPLRYGAGIKGKIGTAMAAGLPVVATTIAAEGMFLEDGRNVLLADTPEEFSEAIALLASDPSRWQEMSHASVMFADHHWGPTAAAQTLFNLLKPLVPGATPCVDAPTLYNDSRN